MSIRHSRYKRVLTITCDNDFEADQLEHAILRRQWLRFGGSGAQIAREEPEPTYSDEDLLMTGSIAPIYNGAPAGIKQLQIRDNEDQSDLFGSIYVQHIFAGNQRPYVTGYKLMRHCGFELLRSPKKATTWKQMVDGEMKSVTKMQHYEIWYLPGKWAADGPIKGMTMEEIRKWVFENICPGNYNVDGQRWALSHD